MKTRVGRKRLAWKWLCQLDMRYPHLAHRARALNYRDRFLMKYDPAVIAMREERQKRQLDKESQSNNSSDNSSSDEDCKEEKTEDRPSAAVIKKQMVPFVQSTAPQINYLDRSWKRSKITDDTNKEATTRPVSPP